MDSGRMYRVYRNQALMRICPFIFSFFFFSNFQILKTFVTLFSGTVRPRRLKHCMHVNNGWMYRVYRNQASAAYLSLFSFFFLSNFQGERGGSVVECRTPEREVGSSKPTAAVLCPWARHFTPRKYWLITQEAVAPSRHDWKIVDWDVKPQHKQIPIFNH